MAVIKTQAEIEVFWGRIYHEYAVERAFFPAHAEFEAASKGELKNVPKYPQRRAVNKADGTTHSDQSYTISATEVPLDDPLKRWEHINKDDYDVRPDLAMFTSLQKSIGRSLGIGVNERCAGLIAKGASDALNEVVYDALSTGFEERTAEEIANIAANMDETGVPKSMRWGCMKPKQWRALRRVAEVIRLDFGGQADVQFPREYLVYQDFRIFSMGAFFGTNFTSSPFDDESIPTSQRFDATNAIAIFWVPDSWVWRMCVEPEYLGPEGQWMPETDQWKVEGRIHQGMAVRDADGMWLLSDDGT